MRHELDLQRARVFESKGDLASARAVYHAILNAEDGQLFVRMRLSALEQITGHYRASLGHALKAADSVRANRDWKQLSAVARRLLSFDEHAAVHNLIMNADWTDPDILANSAILSQQLWLTDHFTEALRLIEVASARVQPSHVLSYSRANALRYCGRLDEATAEYERCIELAPDYAYAHWSLAYHEPASAPGARIDRIKRAQARTAGPGIEQAYLSYALFKEFDEAGDTGSAWTALQAGARIKRQSIGYDSAREQEGYCAMRQLVTQDFVKSQSAEALPDQRVPVFIVGLPRSGTTVLERILGNHSLVTSAGELNDFTSALCWHADKFPGNAMDPASIERVRNIDFSQAGKTYLARTQYKAPGGAYLIDKNPMNFFNAGYICKALPMARIVCVNRAPMDSCFSNLKELFSGEAYGYSYDLDELADHYLRFSALGEHWRKVLPGRIHFVDYEDLVADPSDTSKRVMDFCGLPFEPDCIDITKNRAPVSTASSSQVRQPINAKGINAWSRYSAQLEPLRARIPDAVPAP